METGATCADRHAIVAHGARGTETSALAGIASASHIVDIAALIVEIDYAAQRDRVSDRHVDHGFGLVAGLTAFSERDASGGAGIKTRQAWLVGDQAHNTGLRTCAEQRALRTGQNFDPFHIGRIYVQVASWLRQRLLIEIESDVWCKAGNASGGEVWCR